MIFETVIGQCNPHDLDVDWVEIDYRQTARRALRLVSIQGRKIDILLPRTSTLKNCDVIGVIENFRIAIRVKPEKLIELSPTTINAALLLASELGNLHYPMDIIEHKLVTLDDGPVQEIADRLMIPSIKRYAIFHPIRSSLATELRDRT